jgi:exodeoxyribonuclease VIII
MALGPGHYRTLSNEDYHADPSISKSKLDVLGDPPCPLKFYDRYLAPDREPHKPTDAMILGSALHVAVLEPDLFPEQYAAAPENVDGRTREGKAVWAAFRAEHEGKIALTAEQYRCVVGQRDAIFRCKEAWRLIENADREESYFAVDPETGLMVRARPDAFDRREMVITDVKRTRGASPPEFGKSAERYRYHVQGGWYPYVVNLATGEAVREFRFVCVEPVRPYAVGLYYLTPEDFTDGLDIARADLRLIAQCQQSGEWPDYAADVGVQPLARLAWAKRQRGN